MVGASSTLLNNALFNKLSVLGIENNYLNNLYAENENKKESWLGEYSGSHSNGEYKWNIIIYTDMEINKNCIKIDVYKNGINIHNFPATIINLLSEEYANTYSASNDNYSYKFDTIDFERLNIKLYKETKDATKINVTVNIIGLDKTNQESNHLIPKFKELSDSMVSSLGDEKIWGLHIFVKLERTNPTLGKIENLI